ncbi:hypothetical protein FM113_09385 [Leucobacter sp. 7(1)]|nr:hypothetical protein FM113_09385 [Leucobacter sp. 7(1)]
MMIPFDPHRRGAEPAKSVSRVRGSGSSLGAGPELDARVSGSACRRGDGADRVEALVCTEELRGMDDTCE